MLNNTSGIPFNCGWNMEDLDELHGNLFSLLSFLDDFTINKIDGDEIVRNHISALVKRLKELIDKHGGRSLNYSIQDEGGSA